MSYAQYCRLNVPVWATPKEVIVAASKKLRRKFNPAEREARHVYYRCMLDQHNKAYRLYRTF